MIGEPDSAAKDARIVRRCRAGDAEAWNELVVRFSRYVLAIATQAYRLPQHDAEDLFQEVFSRVYSQLHTLRDDTAIRPWIGQLTRRLAIDRLRRASNREAPTEILPEEASPDAELERIDLALDIHEAMAGLPPHCQEILDRFFARDESYVQIADALELAAGTIASRISRCLTRMRSMLESR
jgi:RNA polymerase sigma-70 factor, ECF subfamily